MSRINDSVRNRFVDNVITGAAQRAGPVTEEAMAKTVEAAEVRLQYPGEVFDGAPATAAERKDLQEAAAKALEQKYGHAWGVSAGGIMTALAQPAPAGESLRAFMAAEGLNAQSLDLSHMNWAGKAVYGAREIAVAEASVRARTGGMPAPIEVSLDGVAPENRAKAEIATSVLRDCEAFRDLVLDSYVVQSGNVPPEIDWKRFGLEQRKMNARARDAGYVTGDLVTNVEVRHEMFRHLTAVAAADNSTLGRLGPDTWFLPHAADRGMPNRASAAQAYEDYTQLMIPAMKSYLQSLGAVSGGASAPSHDKH